MTTPDQTPMTPRRLCVWFPDWPIQRLVRRDATLRAQPIAMSQADGRTERIASCSPVARKSGVTVGQRTPDAQSLAGPNLRLFPYRPEADRRELTRLAISCERFSPVTALEPCPEPAALLLDVSGLAALWDARPGLGEQRLIEAVSSWLNAERLVGRVAIAPTVGLALAAARSTSEPIIVPATAIEDFARSAPLAALRVEAGTLDKLQSLGFTSVGQLLDLPRSALPARFGSTLAERLDQLLGSASEPLESCRAKPPLIERIDFENAVTNQRAIEHAVGRLLAELAAAMSRRRLGALRVLITYWLDAPGNGLLTESVALRLFRPTNSARELTELAQLQADDLRFSYAVRAIRAVVGSSTPIENRQRTLFDDDARDDPHQLALLINRLASRVGADGVSRVEKRRSVDPQRRYELVPATDVPARAYHLTPGEAERGRRLPLGLLPNDPVGLAVETDAAGEPTRVVLPPSRRVVRCWGPDRIETGWWRRRGRQPVIHRDAYWVELETGQRLWLCHDLRGGRWSLAGEFA